MLSVVLYCIVVRVDISLCGKKNSCFALHIAVSSRPLVYFNQCNKVVQPHCTEPISRGYCQKVVSAYALHRHLRSFGTNPSIFSVYTICKACRLILLMTAAILVQHEVTMATILCAQQLIMHNVGQSTSYEGSI